MFLSLFKKNPQREAARSLYISAMEQARHPVFYTDYAVPDTLDGRFDLMTLHVYLILRALKLTDVDDLLVSERRGMSQKLFEEMFRNLDATLRQMGVGDLSVAKKIRPMAEAFYGRVGAYELALGGSGIHGGDLKAGAPDEMPAQPDKADADLTAALLRNIYGTDAANRDLHVQASALAGYVEASVATLSRQSIGRLLGGIVNFPAPDPL